MKQALEELRRQILAKYRTIHAFCRDNPELKRSTVYLVLAGKYPGNSAKQIEKIQGILTGKQHNTEPSLQTALTELEAYTVLQETKCAHCRRLDKRACSDCRMQAEREAQALVAYLRSREVV